MKKHFFRFALLFLALLFTAGAALARQINVRGIVIDEKGTPLGGVAIYRPGETYASATTDDDGKYLLIAEDDDVLRFESLGMEDQEVPVSGRLILDVTLVKESIVLDVVTKVAKVKLKKVVPEPTDIEVKGNWAYIKTNIKVPSYLFNASTRLVVQPALYNVTAKKKWYLKPIVYDGQRYHYTQDRMLDHDVDLDPLYKFSQIRQKSNNNYDIVMWRDSVYLENPNHDFHCDMLMAIENYNRILYRDTTTIARGTVNPMRWFQYSLDATQVTDSAFFPTPEMQMRDTKGNIMLTFRVNDAKLYMDEGNNREEMDRLLGQLHEVESDPDAALKSFTISSTSSPEGNYAHNLTLSKQRMKSALDVIIDNLSATTRRYMELNSDATVATWEDMVEILRRDSLVTEAEAIQTIIDHYPGNADMQSVYIRRLPFYGPVLEGYLPQLRKVDYSFLTSRFRYLTDSEIEEAYAKDPSRLTKYEFFRLYRYLAPDDAKREEYVKKALEVYPNFTVASVDYAGMLIAQGKPDYKILDPIIKSHPKKLPSEAIYNQVIACLNEYKYGEADSLVSLLPDVPRYHKARLYTDVFNGRYDEDAILEISDESPRNEVVILLAKKENARAWYKAQLLGDTAEEEYIKAIAAYRVDEYMPALTHIQKALELDPSLREIAKIDGDLIELMKDVDDEEAADE